MNTKVFVISTSSDLVDSLRSILKYTRGTDLVVISPPPPLQGRREQWVLNTFRALATAIDSLTEGTGTPISLRKVIGVMELWDPELSRLEELNPVATEATWSAVAGMLVLAFPEIHWIFHTPHRPACSRLGRLHILKPGVSLVSLVDLVENGFVSLFDPSGLRNCIRHKLVHEQEGSVAPYIPIRDDEAIVVDEERAYSFFNAYVAYRFGYRCNLIVSYAMMSGALTAPREAGEKKLALSIEDLYLNFADRDPDSGSLSSLRTRDGKFARLTEPSHRILVTVGHRQKRHDATFIENLAYLQARRENGQSHAILYKPISGIFDLWERGGMPKRLRGRGLAAGFQWPPHKEFLDERNPSHSAPGRLLEVADHLIRRAKRVLETTTSVDDRIVGAVFALEAQELLGNRTPTTALEALALKHQLEVTVECMFYGVQYNLNVQSRFLELAQEVKSIGRWFHPKTRRLSELNAESGITSRLVLCFRDYYQFDEEQDCLNRVRRLHRQTLLQRSKSVAWMYFPLRWYMDNLLGSVTRFALALGFWVFFLGILYTIALQGRFPQGFTLWNGICYAVVAFFGLGAPNGIRNPSDGEHLVTMLAVTSGFLHLGVFVSHIYSLIARR